MPKRSKKKLPQELITASISRLSHDGRGVAHINGKTTFLFGGLPDETVQFRYTRQKNQFDEGDVKAVLTASPSRQNPKCEHFSICGGCSFQHLGSNEQLAYKQKALIELLQHQANLQAETILPPIISDPWGYRRKARLSVKYIPKKQKVLVGFHERHHSFIADINACPVLHPSVGEKISWLSEMFMQLNQREHIAQLEIAVGDDQTAIIVRHLKPLDAEDMEILENFSETHNFMLYLQPKGVESIYLQFPKNKSPLLQYQLPDYGLTFKFHPSQFTQINHSVNSLMIARALELLDLNENDRVLDLFCGIGNFTLPIAQFCNFVIGVEGDASAVSQAKENAQLNHLHHCEFYRSNLFECDNTESWLNQKYNKILLDPPRSGAKEILAFSRQWEAERIVYISCNPATLARDARILSEQGYHLKSVGVIDMFPHTKHVEAISLFTRGKKR